MAKFAPTLRPAARGAPRRRRRTDGAADVIQPVSYPAPNVPQDSFFPSSRFSATERRAALAGRTAEMRDIERAYAAGRDKRQTRTVTVVGAAGLGKTRLVRNFPVRTGDASGAAPRVYRGSAREGGPAYEVFARVLRARFGTIEGMDPEAAKAQVRTQLAAVLEDRKVGDVAYFLGQLLDLRFQDSPLIKAVEGDPQQIRSMRRAIIKSFLETDASKGKDPLVLMFDDLEWAHDDSLELLSYLVESLRGPMLLVCIARPEMLARRDGWRRSGSDRHLTIELSPLADADAAAVMHDLLGPCGDVEEVEELVDSAVTLAAGTPVPATRSGSSSTISSARRSCASRRPRPRAGTIGRSPSGSRSATTPTPARGTSRCWRGTGRRRGPPRSPRGRTCKRPKRPARASRTPRRPISSPRVCSSSSRGGAAHSRMGRLCRETGRLDEASRQLTASLALFGQAQDEQGTAGTLDDIGRLHWLRGDPVLAVEYIARALSIRRRLGDARNLASSLNNLGLVQQDAGNYKLAVEAFDEALRIRRGIGDLVGASHALYSLGGIAQAIGDEERARAMFQEAYEAAKETGDRNRIALILTNLGATFDRMGDATKALGLFKQAEDLADELGDRVGLADARSALGKAYATRRDFTRARDSLKRAVELLTDAECKVKLGIALRALGAVTAAANPEAWGDGADHLKRSIAIFEELGNDVELARSFRAYADLLRRTPEHADNPTVAAEAQKFAGRAEDILAK